MSTPGPREPTIPVPLPAPLTREIRRILLLVGLAGIVLFGALTVAILYVVRVGRFQAEVMASIVEVSDEGQDRQSLGEQAREALFASDFDTLDATVRELRDSQERFANGAWKLTAYYDGVSGTNVPDDFDWERAIERAEAWTNAHPDSIAARLVLAELWIASSWLGRDGKWSGGKWDPSANEEERVQLFARLEKADATLKSAIGLDEYCPHRAATELRLAVSGRWPRAVEQDVYRKAVADEPDYQPYYSLHLYYLEAFWEGEPGEWARAAQEIADQAAGPEHYARAVWYRGGVGRPSLDGVSWPLLKEGFRRLVARHPDSFEIKSAACFFASQYKDVPETRRLLDEVGFRMQTTVWADRKQFAQVHRWATFEDAERTRDPLARWFARLWRF